MTLFGLTRRKKLVWTAVCGVVFFVLAGLYLTSRFSADTVTPVAGDDRIDIMAMSLAMDTHTGSLTAYNANGGKILDGEPAATGSNTSYNSFGAISAPETAITPVGVYTMGQVWTSRQDATQGGQTGTMFEGQFIPYHPGIGGTQTIADAIGPYFIDLSGQPTNGGTPLGGLGTDGTRHIGIHSRHDSQILPTNGCVRLSTVAVEKIIRSRPTGKKLIISDVILAGTVKPVDYMLHFPQSVPQGYQTEMPAIFNTSPMPTLGGTVRVENESGEQQTIHYFGNNKRNGEYRWIAEVAKPTGTYNITGEAPNYSKNTTSVTVTRRPAIGNMTAGFFLNVTGEYTPILPRDHQDAFWSGYFGMFVNGYNYGLSQAGESEYPMRVSQYDTLLSKELLKPAAGSNLDPNRAMNLSIPIDQIYPSAGEFNSRYGVFLIESPWQDVKYGTAYNRMPELGEQIYSFTAGSGSWGSITVPDVFGVGADMANPAQLNKGLKALKWGLAVKPTEKIGHVYNDYLEMPHQCNNHYTQLLASGGTSCTGGSSGGGSGTGSGTGEDGSEGDDDSLHPRIATFSGVIRGANNTSLTGVEVTLNQNGSSQSFTTDARGSYSFTASVGPATLSIAGGTFNGVVYQALTQEINLEEGENNSAADIHLSVVTPANPLPDSYYQSSLAPYQWLEMLGNDWVTTTRQTATSLQNAQNGRLAQVRTLTTQRRYSEAQVVRDEYAAAEPARLQAIRNKSVVEAAYRQAHNLYLRAQRLKMLQEDARAQSAIWQAEVNRLNQVLAGTNLSATARRQRQDEQTRAIRQRDLNDRYFQAYQTERTTKVTSLREILMPTILERRLIMDPINTNNYERATTLSF